MRRIVNFCKRFALCFFSLLCLLSCGLDVIYYLDYIRPDNLYFTDVMSRVQLPSSSDEGYGDSEYFTNFIIFYRIYTSSQLISEAIREDDVATTGAPYLINPTLRNDISTFRRYTDYTSTTTSTSNLENVFTNADRGYYRLALEGQNITSALSRSSLGRELILSFPGNAVPTMTLQEAGTGNVIGSYRLQRATDLIQPLPSNRYFLNHQDLYNSANAQNPNINPDVATNSNYDIRYTYICLYIAAKGREPLGASIYSQPSYLGVFRLPESGNVP